MTTERIQEKGVLTGELRVSRKEPPVSLTERIYKELRAAIVTSILPPGSEVSEQELAVQFNVSKTPVREALGRLVSDGYVRSFPRRGYQIAPLTVGALNELLDVRVALECGAIELACSRITPEELDALRALAEKELHEGRQMNYQQHVALNRAFHEKIARATRNERFFNLVMRCIDDLERYFYLGAEERITFLDLEHGHMHLVEVIAAGDPAAAREALKRHTEKTRVSLLRQLSASSELQGASAL